MKDKKSQDEEELFDIIIPPGVPRRTIADVLKKFDVEIVERSQRMHFANMEGDSRDLLAFRGKKEVIEKVHEYILEELKKFIDED